MATAGSYRLRSESRAGSYTPDASSRFLVQSSGLSSKPSTGTRNCTVSLYRLAFSAKAGLYSNRALTAAPRCFQNPDNSFTECRVFLAASLWAIQKTIVLSIVGILFALSAVKNEQLKHAEKSKCNLLTTASNSIRFFINPSCRCLSRVLQLVLCLLS